MDRVYFTFCFFSNLVYAVEMVYIRYDSTHYASNIIIFFNIIY